MAHIKCIAHAEIAGRVEILFCNHLAIKPRRRPRAKGGVDLVVQAASRVTEGMI